MAFKMTDSSASIVSKVWNYAHVLKNAGVGYGDYIEQITYLLFLKLAPPSLKLRRAGSEMTELGFDPPSLSYGETSNPIPDAFAWSVLSGKSGDDFEPSGARWTIREDRPEGWRGGANQIHYRLTLSKTPRLRAHPSCLCG